MGGRLSFLRRKRAKTPPAAVEVAPPAPVEAAPPPPEKFDDSTFWVGLKAVLKFKKGLHHTPGPLDRSKFHIRDATKLSEEEIEEVKGACKALGDKLDATKSGKEVAMEYFTLALAHLGLGETDAASAAFLAAIDKDPTLGRAYTNLSHTLLLDAQSDETLERVVGYLECALKYDDTETRENTMLLAEVHSLRGNHAAALEVYGQLEHAEEEWENVFHMARCQWELKEYGKSIDLLGKLQLGPDEEVAPAFANKRIVLADAMALLVPPGAAVVAAR
ncbi:Aste57867_9608 [Aphanomyces stellatus]|uniref:Aste57867_9608 protein n=1 Tax=Aphanomyces stellatus TaxID=120398 RepID=A0A485KNE9_9STRA|nr:hypothetical protein As57867_009570 [Aphanomyces stellatus]VFT86487.1 Aste57867_9608 [Aphanomyces stellatus]